MIIRIKDFSPAEEGAFQVLALQEEHEIPLLWRAEEPVLGGVYEIEETNEVTRALKLGVPEAGKWGPETDALRWRKRSPQDGKCRMEILRERATIRRAVREALDARGFLEIEAPLLIKGTTPDSAVESFPVGEHYLATSTEYQMKRLVVGGFENIYSLTKNFRKDDSAGSVRNPEFTMLEWGRVGAGMKEIEADAEAFVLQALDALKKPTRITTQGREIDFKTPWTKWSVAEAIERITGVPMPDFGAASCLKAAEAAGIEIRDDWREDRDFLFSLLMDHIQPELGKDGPLFLCDWPLFQTTSAKKKDKLTADRSELFIAGIELADGFAGLADPALQEQFFAYALHVRQASGQASVELDQKYLEAMRLGAPYGAGMAMGFDRLVMLLTGQDTIRNVLAFAWDEL